MNNNKTIPLFLMEEHHEAFFVWNYGHTKGYIRPFGNTLLHVDSHDDMFIARLNSSVDELEDDLEQIYAYVYEELGIASFIVPAIYRGLINNYTFLNRYDAVCGKRTNRYLASYQAEGKFFKIGVVSPLLRAELEKDDSLWGRYQFYSNQEIGLGSTFTTSQPLILDIDLDYFSCDNSLSSAKTRIEITEEAFYDFLNNKYHPFRILPAAAITVYQENEKYYLQYNEFQEVPNLKKVSWEVIDARIQKFGAFLERNKLKPGLISLCRSRLSGYTPADQWQYIEKKLLAELQRLYPLDIHHFSEMEQIYGKKIQSHLEGVY